MFAYLEVYETNQTTGNNLMKPRFIQLRYINFLITIIIFLRLAVTYLCPKTL